MELKNVKVSHTKKSLDKIINMPVEEVVRLPSSIKAGYATQMLKQAKAMYTELVKTEKEYDTTIPSAEAFRDYKLDELNTLSGHNHYEVSLIFRKLQDFMRMKTNTPEKFFLTIKNAEKTLQSGSVEAIADLRMIEYERRLDPEEILSARQRRNIREGFREQAKKIVEDITLTPSEYKTYWKIYDSFSESNQEDFKYELHAAILLYMKSHDGIIPSISQAAEDIKQIIEENRKKPQDKTDSETNSESPEKTFDSEFSDNVLLGTDNLRTDSKQYKSNVQGRSSPILKNPVRESQDLMKSNRRKKK